MLKLNILCSHLLTNSPNHLFLSPFVTMSLWNFYSTVMTLESMWKDQQKISSLYLEIILKIIRRQTSVISQLIFEDVWEFFKRTVCILPMSPCVVPFLKLRVKNFKKNCKDEHKTIILLLHPKPAIVFLKSLWGHKCFLWGYWYPCFGLLVISACVILRFTSSSTTADCIEVSRVAKPFQSTYLQIMCPQVLVGVQTHDRQCRPHHSAVSHSTTPVIVYCFGPWTMIEYFTWVITDQSAQ